MCRDSHVGTHWHVHRAHVCWWSTCGNNIRCEMWFRNSRQPQHKGERAVGCRPMVYILIQVKICWADTRDLQKDPGIWTCDILFLCIIYMNNNLTEINAFFVLFCSASSVHRAWAMTTLNKTRSLNTWPSFSAAFSRHFHSSMFKLLFLSAHCAK